MTMTELLNQIIGVLNSRRSCSHLLRRISKDQNLDLDVPDQCNDSAIAIVLAQLVVRIYQDFPDQCNAFGDFYLRKFSLQSVDSQFTAAEFFCSEDLLSTWPFNKIDKRAVCSAIVNRSFNTSELGKICFWVAHCIEAVHLYPELASEFLSKLDSAAKKVEPSESIRNQTEVVLSDGKPAPIGGDKEIFVEMIKMLSNILENHSQLKVRAAQICALMIKNLVLEGDAEVLARLQEL